MIRVIRASKKGPDVLLPYLSTPGFSMGYILKKYKKHEWKSQAKRMYVFRRDRY